MGGGEGWPNEMDGSGLLKRGDYDRMKGVVGACVGDGGGVRSRGDWVAYRVGGGRPL